MKPTRRVCGATTAGVRTFKHSPTQTVTGCRAHPMRGERFCEAHKDSSPSVPLSNVTKETRKQLVKGLKITDDEAEDMICILEGQ